MKHEHLIARGGDEVYVSPAVDLLHIEVEQGFAESVNYDEKENTENTGYDQTPEEW